MLLDRVQDPLEVFSQWLCFHGYAPYLKALSYRTSTVPGAVPGSGVLGEIPFIHEALISLGKNNTPRARGKERVLDSKETALEDIY